MEALSSTPTTPKFHHKTPSKPLLSRINRFTCFISRDGHSFSCPISPPNLTLRSQRNRRGFTVVEAVKKKDNGEKSKKKESSHGYVVKPDESTGYFPESILLKQRKVEEDGKLLPEFADDLERQMFEYMILQTEDMVKGRMRHYQVICLIHQDHKDNIAAVKDTVQGFVRENKGKIWRFLDWGFRRLAYKIKKTTHAHYFVMNFEIEANLVNDFKNMLDKDERVIRHLVVKKKRAITEYCPPPPEYHTLVASEKEYEEDYDEDYDEEDYDDEEDDYDEEEDYEEEEEDDAQDSEEDDPYGVKYLNSYGRNTDNKTNSHKTAPKKSNIGKKKTSNVGSRRTVSNLLSKPDSQPSIVAHQRT